MIKALLPSCPGALVFSIVLDRLQHCWKFRYCMPVQAANIATGTELQESQA
jgi:hypothetical protein